MLSRLNNSEAVEQSAGLTSMEPVQRARIEGSRKSSDGVTARLKLEQ